MSNDWITKYLDNSDFAGLFVEELGWNRPGKSGRKVKVETEMNTLEVIEVAGFHGVSVWSCAGIPSGHIQRLVDKTLRKESAERIIVFYDKARQVWRWPQTGDAAGAGTPRLVAHEHYVGKPNEALRQRLKFIQIGLDEDDISILELVRRLRRAFDSDKITKSFYSRFAQQHRDLTGAIKGIDVSDKSTKPELRWYASILLNRLMFIYFMQRKGFLDGDNDYLRNRLLKIRKLKRPGSFYEFYKDFLIPLFHEGLGADVESRTIDDDAIVDLIGDIPYVNGGIFSKHPLEETNDIRVSDTAFEKIFDFFDQWQWHLDDRPSGNPNEINPDVLGYIFEQFVNNREEAAKGNKSASDNADKGAYYTKEDVTGYMTVNTLVPVFLDRLLAQVRVNLWRQLALDPDRYIWPSVKHGCETSLPEAIGTDSEAQPNPSWDAVAVPAELGLPGESWWEVLDRRRHVREVQRAARAGEIDSIDLCLTHNLDVDTLAVDLIDSLDTPEDVVSAWEVLSDLRIIDPMCGSGAFLFAALNILHRLYSATFDAAELHGKTSKDKRLLAIVEMAQSHPNRDYFLLKHAALNNLYGVDIMNEAVEIARLRLFLKLISQVDRTEDIEPLPDLEFNIRCGNSLIGALTVDDIASKVDLLNSNRLEDVQVAAEATAEAFRSFTLAQQAGAGHAQVAQAKEKIKKLGERTKGRLNEWWFQSDHGSNTLEQYLISNQPFHWFMEFPEVLSRGGFDVVIGNPPYVATTKIGYKYSGFRTDRCPDIYAPCLERAASITAINGRLSMIVPMNLAWGGEYVEARKVLVERFGSIWASTYDQMPSRLFEGVGTRNTIVLAGPGTSGVHTTSFNKWVSDFRPHLMVSQRYVRHEKIPDPWPKVGHGALLVLATSPRGGMSSLYLNRPSSHRLGYKKTANYWISVFREDPPCLDGNRKPMPQKEVGDLFLGTADDAYLALAVAASRPMFLWWVFVGDAFHVLGRQFCDFPLRADLLPGDDRKALVRIGKALEKRLASKGDHLLWTPYAGAWYGNFDLTRCRDITAEADEIILRHFGLESQTEVFEVEYRNYMKSGGERPGTVRGAQPDRDR